MKDFTILLKTTIAKHGTWQVYIAKRENSKRSFISLAESIPFEI
jgi:hypothetical protein